MKRIMLIVGLNIFLQNCTPVCGFLFILALFGLFLFTDIWA
ncbi:hypothetical protein EH5_00285 [Bacillus subtilis]|nr:hypothetical protein EH5_00285 [Bacillus subtilis]